MSSFAYSSPSLEAHGVRREEVWGGGGGGGWTDFSQAVHPYDTCKKGGEWRTMFLSVYACLWKSLNISGRIAIPLPTF